MVKNGILFTFLAFFFFLKGILAQELIIFSIEDFDLKGDVKSCRVSTDYGKEEYYFNEAGLLIKSVTRYNDQDYDNTYYKYEKGRLAEKRLENYRDKAFVSNTSIANFYSIDTTLNVKVTEKIITYNKDLIDQYEYYYEDDRLIKITRNNNDGVDETLISYSEIDGEKTKTYTTNGELEKSERISLKQENDSLIEKNVLIKKFIDGKPSSAVEEVFDGKEKILTKTQFLYSDKKASFEPQEILMYTYDENEQLLTEVSKTGRVVENKEFVYQFDQNGNWIKEIITPDNTYKTRKITYYNAEDSEVDNKK